MSDVFISYARNEAGRAGLLKEKLEAFGLQVFFDLDGGIHAGDSFPERISLEVIDAKAVLACWTPHALTRSWVRRECMMAREFNKLVPVAIERLTALDLKEFIDASYEDLTDWNGQETHFAWGQTLAALARKLDDWVEAHPNEATSSDTIDRANTIRKAAHEARKGSAPGGISPPSTLTEVQKVWTQLRESTDPDKLVRFAESFPGTSEAYHARERGAQMRAETAAERALDKSSLPAVKAFVAQWPTHHHFHEISGLIPTLEAQQEAQRKLGEQRRALEKAKAEAEAQAQAQAETQRKLAEERRESDALEKSRAANDREAKKAFGIVIAVILVSVAVTGVMAAMRTG